MPSILPEVILFYYFLFTSEESSQTYLQHLINPHVLHNLIVAENVIARVLQEFLLGGPAPRGSGFGTEHKNKYPAGILYPLVAKYLASEPDLAKQKLLLSGLIERLIVGLSMPGRYIGIRI